MDRQFMRDTADAVKARLPDNYGFVVIAAPFNKPDGTNNGDGRLLYASNIEREQALAMLKEWMLKCGAAEDWMRHL